MTHVNLGKAQPTLYKKLEEMDAEATRYALAVGLDHRLIELVNIRVSQLNGCAFCLRLHTKEALKHGESFERLAILAAWWESDYFSEGEVHALRVAESVTSLGRDRGRVGHGDVFSPEQLAAVSWLAVTTNAWNRVALQSHYQVKP